MNVTDGTTTHTVVAGWPAVSDPRLVQKPDGTIFLYFGGSTPDLKTQGALRFVSIDGGVTWSGPVKTNPSSTIGDVQASALRRDGTPIFTQDGTGFIKVYHGDNGGTLHNVVTPCCGYDESIAVDTSGLAQLAFWSNATGKSGYLYLLLDDTGAAVGAAVNLAAGSDAQALPAINRVPLVADGAGNTFMAWPGERHVTIAALDAGKLKRKFAIRIAGAPGQLAWPSSRTAGSCGSSGPRASTCGRRGSATRRTRRRRSSSGRRCRPGGRPMPWRQSVWQAASRRS